MKEKQINIDSTLLRLMSQIMQDGMTGYKIADLFNDANQKYNFYKNKFESPGKIQKRKEQYAFDFLVEMKSKGWDDAIIYVAELLCDSSKAYYNEDESHIYPEEKINRLTEKIRNIPPQYFASMDKKHGIAIKSLLSSIRNDEMREVLYNDIKDIQNCITCSAWKPALVLSGSVLEAILTDWLESEKDEVVKKAFKELHPTKKNKKVSEYYLEELIDVAENLQLIHGYHAAISDGIRNFRNLIHPSIALRKKISVNKSIATIGLNIIWAILQERKKIESIG